MVWELGAKSPLATRFHFLPWQASPEDCDQVYEETERFIARHLPQLLQGVTTTETTLEPDLLKAQQEALKELQLFLELVDFKLEVLEPQLDTQRLEQQLYPLRILKDRLHKALLYAEREQELMAEIQSTHQWVLQLLKQCQSQEENPTHKLTGHLDHLYDTCDALADRLDLLSESCSIASVEPRYEALIRLVNVLQDLLDGI